MTRSHASPLAKLQRLSPRAICIAGLFYVLAVATADYFAPPRVGFTLFYLLGSALVGWAAGKRPALAVSAVAATLILIHDWQTSQTGAPAWITLWNLSTRLLVVTAGGWISAELAHLTRNLGRLVEARTARWKAAAQRHQRAEAALRSSQRQLAAAVDLARLVNWKYEVTTGLFTFDDRFFKLYGTTADREKGHQMSAETFAREFVHPEEAHLVAEYIQQALATTDPNYTIQFESRIRRRDGQTRHMLVRLAITKDAAGRTTTLHGINQDITERKLAEQQLADALDLNQKMLAASPMGIIAFKAASGQCIFANEALARIIGGPVSKILEGNFRHLPNWEQSGLLRLAQEALERQEVRSAEIYDTSRFGKTFWVEAIMAPFVRGGELHLLHLCYDITGRKRLERQILEISDREQARIGQDIHDGLCQQLVSLAFDANCLEQELSNQCHSRADTARRFAALLDQSITDARQVARGLFPIRLQADGLAPALEDLAQTASQRLPVMCQAEITGEIPAMDLATATHFYRIAQEALNNALQHGRPKQITFKLLATAGTVELTVEDDGRGISPEALQNPAGMGLHIMRYRARAIGATLRLAPGLHGGTRLTCRLNTSADLARDSLRCYPLSAIRSRQGAGQDSDCGTFPLPTVILPRKQAG